MQTALPLMSKFFDAGEMEAIQKKYVETQKIYLDLRDRKGIQAYVQDQEKQNLFQLHENVYMDFRITDILLPELQDIVFPAHLTISRPTHEKLTLQGESMDDVFARNQAYISDISDRFPTKTIITITHKDSAISMIKTFKDFDYLTQKRDHALQNGQINIRYRDNDRDTQVDLHKPYIDNYRFAKGKKEYRRVPEVMDCWFES